MSKEPFGKGTHSLEEPNIHRPEAVAGKLRDAVEHLQRFIDVERWLGEPGVGYNSHEASLGKRASDPGLRRGRLEPALHRPVLYRECEVPLRLARLQHIDFRTDYARGLKLLLKALGVDQPMAAAAVAAPTSPKGSQPAASESGVRRMVAEQVEMELQRRLAAEQARQEEERQQAAGKARLEEEQRQAAEQARLEEERGQVAELARLEEGRKAAAEKARLEQEERERQAAAEKARVEQEERERQAALAVAEKVRLEQEGKAAEEKALQAERERQRLAAEQQLRRLKRDETKAVASGASFFSRQPLWAKVVVAVTLAIFVGLLFYWTRSRHAVSVALRSGWAVGDKGTILHTEDGGQSWEAQSSGTTNDLRSIFGTSDGAQLWAVGDKGTILHYTAQAGRWEEQSSGATDGLSSIFGTNDGAQLWAVGGSLFGSGTILHYMARAGRWEAQRSGTTAGLFSVTFVRR